MSDNEKNMSYDDFIYKKDVSTLLKTISPEIDVQEVLETCSKTVFDLTAADFVRAGISEDEAIKLEAAIELGKRIGNKWIIEEQREGHYGNKI